MENPSIALIPSAYKTSKLYTVLPNNGDGDFTFSRSSGAKRFNNDGLVEESPINTPRIDYNNKQCPVLLLEAQNTNLLLRSEEFDNASWAKNSGATVNANQVISPEGTLTADRANGEDSADYVHQTPVTTATNTYTFTVFIKNIDSNMSRITVRTSSTSASLDINWIGNVLDSVTLNTGVSASFEEHTNGWYRVILTYVETLANQQVRITPTFIAEIKSVYIWGAKLEELDFQTSYIETTSSTVTREEDVCIGSGSSTSINSKEGVFYVNSRALFDDGTFRTISITDGGISNVVYIRYESTSNQIRGLFIVGGVTQASIAFVLADMSQFNKIAFKWKENDFALWVGGVEVGTDSSGSVFAEGTLDEIRFDAGTGTQDFYGEIKELRVYKTALTDAELQELTS